MSSASDVPSAALQVSRFTTQEERLARESNNVLLYFRLQDSLCRGFLRLATCRWEFQGLKLLFPFVREMSLLGLSRGTDQLSTWMYLAFMAGHELGVAHPEALGEVAPGRELRETVVRLGILQRCSGEPHLTFSGLAKACARIVHDKWKDVRQDQLEAVLLEAVLKMLRTGFVAATFSRTDPQDCEFVWEIPDRISDSIPDILPRLLVGAGRTAMGRPKVELMEHPLLRLAREYYPGKQVELETALEFFRERLGALGVTSENECPASELDLAEWIAAGLKYGRRLQAQCPEVVAAILAECQQNDLEGTLRTVRKVAAKGTEPLRLVETLKEWQEGAFGWAEPRCYGDELARVVYFADFAIWIPWVTPGAHLCPAHL